MPYRMVLKTDDSILTFPLKSGESLLGSCDECGLRLTDPTISRRHARVRVDGDSVEVEDLGSTNGTSVRGRDIEGAVPVSVGDPLTFGTVEGRLEHVEDEDLLPAVRFEDEGEPSAAKDEKPSRGTTASVGSLRRFPLDHFPRWIRCLEDREPLAEAAQIVGASLFEVLPCHRVSITGGAEESEGIQFDAVREDTDGAETVPLSIETGSGTVTVEFFFESQVHANRTVVETAARFLCLVDRREPPRPEAESPAPPEPPKPPTVVLRVREIYEDAARVARGDVSVLITGESGTGKEVLARYVHQASPRSDEPFVAINCAALPRDLLEAELFGIEQGVATGVRSRPGKFELADGGTLFLDEIADMAPETQAKILRVLQEGEVYRVGGQEPRSARVRLVSATNQDVDEAMKAGGFRQDLYHRIADWRVDLPPLRERQADIPNLAAFFLQREARKLGVRVRGISRAAMERLRSFAWPGNIRQLEREMARAALFLGDGDLLQAAHLQEELESVEPVAGGTLRERLDRWERLEIEQAIAEQDGNLSAVARALDIGRSTLYRRMKDLEIETP